MSLFNIPPMNPFYRLLGLTAGLTERASRTRGNGIPMNWMVLVLLGVFLALPIHEAIEVKTNEGDPVKATIADARKVIDQVNAGQGTVGKLLHDEALYRETTASMTNLKEILQKINQGQGTIGKIVNNQELYNNAKLTLQKLDQATEGLEDQGPLSVLGTAVSKLF